jgi:hypothetical protein
MERTVVHGLKESIDGAECEGRRKDSKVHSLRAITHSQWIDDAAIDVVDGEER